MLRRLLLACLLFVAGLSLMSWNPLVGAAFAACIAVAPCVVALALNSSRERSPIEF